MSVPFRLAYVAYTFPVLTQTFTTREVLALGERGIDVHVHAARCDPAAQLDDLAERARPLTLYLPPANSAATLRALVRLAIRRPVRLAATFATCLGGGYRDRPVLSRLRALRHFLLGVALASRLAREGGYDHVHAQFVDAGSTLAYVASRLTDVPFSFTNHTAYNPFLLRPKVAWARTVISISEFDRERVAAEAPDARSKSAVCRVGIDVGAWAGLPRRPERGRLLSVAALRPKKGHAELLRAASELRGGGTDVHVVIAGDGAERAALEQLAGDLDVSAEFLGAVGPQRVREELMRAAAFVLPCRVAANGDLDGIPVAIMEAMAAGVPVVTSRLSGIPELVEDGVTGHLAEPGDVASLVAALRRCLGGDAEHGCLVARAGRRVRDLHDLDRTSAALAGILRSGGAS